MLSLARGNSGEFPSPPLAAIANPTPIPSGKKIADMSRLSTMYASKRIQKPAYDGVWKSWNTLERPYRVFKVSPLLATENPAINSLHAIAGAHYTNAHVHVLVLGRKANLIITALKTQPGFQHYLAALIARGHCDIEAQDRSPFVDRERLVVGGFE